MSKEISFRLALLVRFHFQAADEQRGKDEFKVVVSPDTDSIPGGRNMGVIGGGDWVFLPISCMDHKRQKRHGDKPLADFVGHANTIACHAIGATSAAKRQENAAVADLHWGFKATV